MLQILSFCGYVSVSVTPRATQRLKVMHRSRPAELLRFFFARDVLVAKRIRLVSQSATAIELAQLKLSGQSQTVLEESY